MKYRDGTLFTSTVMKNYNGYEDKFTEDDGLQIAFAVIDFETDDYSDVAGRQLEEYLEIEVSFATYNWEDPDGITSKKVVIEHHPCTDAELGKNKFSPLFEG